MVKMGVGLEEIVLQIISQPGEGGVTTKKAGSYMKNLPLLYLNR
jgi:hypothetical protein